jgi:aryl-phospho-beta-D-glucosidase BglC (GH1 family)
MKSKNTILFALALGLTCTDVSAASISPEESMTGRSDAENHPLQRGINVNPWFRKPAISGSWNRYSEKGWSFSSPAFPTYDRQSYFNDLQSLRTAGFDFLRVPIHVGPFLSQTPDQRRQEFRNIGIVLNEALTMGFKLVINLQPSLPGKGSYESIASTSETRKNYIDVLHVLVSEIGQMAPDRIFVETINEPSTECGDRAWSNFQNQIVTSISEDFPKTQFVLTGACYSDIASLITLNPTRVSAPADRVYYTFHYYKPFVFTHQGNSWAGDPGNRIVTGLEWPSSEGNVSAALTEIRRTAPDTEAFAKDGSAGVSDAIKLAQQYYAKGADEASISADFDVVTRWADKYRIPRSHIILGEFGVLKQEGRWHGASMKSAARWTKAVRSQAERIGVPWAMWSYKEGFSLAIEDDGVALHNELLDALGLTRANAEGK